MNKAFTRESDHEDDDEPDVGTPLPAGQKNYITPGGYSRLKAELDRLVDKERPETVGIVSCSRRDRGLRVLLGNAPGQRRRLPRPVRALKWP